MPRKRILLTALAILPLVGCFEGTGMPAGGHFVDDTNVIEGEISADWYFLGLEGGELRSPHGKNAIFLESVSASFYKANSVRPEMAVYFSIKPNFSIGSMGNNSKEELAGFLHSRLEQGIEKLGGEYQRLVPSPTDKSILEQWGEIPVATGRGVASVRELTGSRWWNQGNLNRFERVLRVESRVTVPMGFLCWNTSGAYRISLIDFKDGRRFYQAYIVVPEDIYEAAMPEALAFIDTLTFHKPKF